MSDFCSKLRHSRDGSRYVLNILLQISDLRTGAERGFWHSQCTSPGLRDACHGRSANHRWNFQSSTTIPGKAAHPSVLEIGSWMPNEIEAISPLVDRLMLLIEGSQCVLGEEHGVEIALREALANAVGPGRLSVELDVRVR